MLYHPPCDWRPCWQAAQTAGGVKNELSQEITDEIRKEVQSEVRRAPGWSGQLGVVMLNAGERARAERAARLSLQLHAEYGVGSPSMAHAVLAKLGIPPPATTTPAPPQ